MFLEKLPVGLWSLCIDWRIYLGHFVHLLFTPVPSVNRSARAKVQREIAGKLGQIAELLCSKEMRDVEPRLSCVLNSLRYQSDPLQRSRFLAFEENLHNAEFSGHRFHWFDKNEYTSGMELFRAWSCYDVTNDIRCVNDLVFHYGLKLSELTRSLQSMFMADAMDSPKMVQFKDARVGYLGKKNAQASHSFSELRQFFLERCGESLPDLAQRIVEIAHNDGDALPDLRKADEKRRKRANPM